MNTIQRDLPDESATQQLGRDLAQALKPPLMIALDGELGAGKTSLVRALIQDLIPGSRVKSPTYTLVETYDVPFGQIHHFDLYRLADPDELEQIDLVGFADHRSVLLIEWPDKGGARTSRPDLRIRLDYAGAGRVAMIEGQTPAGLDVIGRLAV